jgi:ATP-dependent DNA helicase RecQ
VAHAPVTQPPALQGALPRARELLHRVFGFPHFRGQQEDIIAHLTGGGDALVLMPTGGGKSLCYQIPALLREGTAVVVSPLIALMQDQVNALLQSGVRAAALNSTLTPGESRRVENALLAGDLDLLYVAPERLLQPRTLALLGECEVALIAIDEAHCVSQWGHDFRPEYLGLAELAARFPRAPRVALTATADAPTRREICARLALEEARVFVDGFDRPNIRYQVKAKDNPRQQLLAFLEGEHRGDAGIVYCLSRRSVDETANWLQERGWTALPYHAGMADNHRQRNQDRFIAEEGIIMVATIAFGMGIDKPNVRFVAHLDLPKSIEAYYQETGRAGRDGLAADAWMVYGLTDVIRLRQMLEGSEADEGHKRRERSKLEAMLGYCEVTECRRQVLLSHLDEVMDKPCGNCDTCLQPVDCWDGSEAAQKALSCVYRTGQRFGVNYLIDVLLGKSNERMQRFGHDRVSTFGIGADLDQRQWRSVFRQLVARGFLGVDMDGHGGLHLTSSSRAVLRGETTLQLRKDRAPEKRPRARTERAQSLTTEHNASLWEALRAHRLELAKAQGVPPYVIFHDSTLLEMARTVPTNLEALARLSGVGQVKLERYGDSFLDLLRAHASAGRPITEAGA